MEKTERQKYYPINVKDKKLHSEFMIFERTNEFKNVDDALRGLLVEHDALDYAKEYIELLQTDLIEAQKKIEELNSDIINIKLGRSTLGEFKEDMERMKDVKCTIGVTEIKYVKEVE